MNFVFEQQTHIFDAWISTYVTEPTIYLNGFLLSLYIVTSMDSASYALQFLCTT